jgi:hypothetical protein
MTKADVFMKKTKNQMMKDLNDKLSEFSQLTQIVEYSAKSIKLSSGVVLEGNDKIKFCRRLLTSKTTLWGKNIDKLLSGEITESQIRSSLAAIGGRSVQTKYGNQIKLNLNTGTSWNSGTKGQRVGTLGPRTASVKTKISEKNSGAKNGMYGIKMSDSDKQYRSQLMQNLILEGKFTPNSNNRNTHWDSTYDGKSYRSSWEALYQCINPTAEYETLRLEYNLENKTKIYIVDFIDHKNKQVVEIKPKELCVGQEFQRKIATLRNWATINEYTLLVVDKEWLLDHAVIVDYTKFDIKTAKKIKALYAANKKN